jgi:hypothetical protein
MFKSAVQLQDPNVIQCSGFMFQSGNQEVRYLWYFLKIAWEVTRYRMRFFTNQNMGPVYSSYVHFEKFSGLTTLQKRKSVTLITKFHTVELTYQASASPLSPFSD